MNRRAAALALAAGLALTACGGDPDPVATTPSATETPSPLPTASPSNPAVPDARSVPVESLLRPGASERGVVYGEMNGVAPEEIVVLSSTPVDDPNLPETPYVDAFAWDPGPAEWVQVFDATTFRDGASGKGPPVGAGDAVGQDVPVLQLVDFQADAAFELVLGVQTYGASQGPLDLWVLSWPAEAFAAEFTHSTERGGMVTLGEHTVTLETGVYRPGDPGCCPSAIERLLIGWDPDAERIAILERTEEEVPPY